MRIHPIALRPLDHRSSAPVADFTLDFGFLFYLSSPYSVVAPAFDLCLRTFREIRGCFCSLAQFPSVRSVYSVVAFASRPENYPRPPRNLRLLCSCLVILSAGGRPAAEVEEPALSERSESNGTPYSRSTLRLSSAALPLAQFRSVRSVYSVVAFASCPLERMFSVQLVQHFLFHRMKFRTSPNQRFGSAGMVPR